MRRKIRADLLPQKIRLLQRDPEKNRNEPRGSADDDPFQHQRIAKTAKPPEQAGSGSLDLLQSFAPRFPALFDAP